MRMNVEQWLEAGKPWNVILNGDCMDLMSHLGDKSVSLGIVDPPYGIGANKEKPHNGWNDYGIKQWDNLTPNKKYFNELFRISKNQIIWGGNYFTEFLPSKMGWIFWDKGQRNFSCSDGELAFSSFDKALRVFEFSRSKLSKERGIHPTQKPVALYRWLLQNYAKTGDKIIDTHSGSGSLACACHLEGFEFLAIEKDEDYYKSSCERLETLRSQGRLFI